MPLFVTIRAAFWTFFYCRTARRRRARNRPGSARSGSRREIGRDDGRRAGHGYWSCPRCSNHAEGRASRYRCLCRSTVRSRRIDLPAQSMRRSWTVRRPLTTILHTCCRSDETGDKGSIRFQAWLCPLAWCGIGVAKTITGRGRIGQAARVGRLTKGSSPIGAMFSRVM